MPRRRNKENRGLPARWQFYHSAYYIIPPAGGGDDASANDGRPKLPPLNPDPAKATAMNNVTDDDEEC